MLPLAQKEACQVARYLPKEKSLGISLLSAQESGLLKLPSFADSPGGAVEFPAVVF